MEIDEIVARIRDEGVEINHARQIIRNTIEYGGRVVTLLPMCVITIAKSTENVNKLKSLTGIKNFIIKIQDYNQRKGLPNALNANSLGIRQDSATLKIVVSSVQAYTTPGTALRMRHTLLGV